MQHKLIDLYRKLKALWRSNPSGATKYEWLCTWAIHTVLFLSVAVAVWLALAAVPRWVELPAVVALWIYGVMHFFIPGLPLLLLPFYLLWTKLRPKSAEAEDDEFKREMRRALVKQQLIDEGISTESDFETPHFGGLRGLSVLPKWLRTCLHIVAGVALIAGGRPVLAFLYLFPDIALFLLNSFVRLRQAWFPR